MILTPEQNSRTVQHYSRLAGEPVTVEIVGGSLYVFGSEIATLRIYRHLAHTREDARQGRSPNLQTWFFALDTSLGFGE